MVDDSFKDYVLDQLQGLPELRCRRMFGGYGLYQGAVFFGIIDAGRLYFKTGPQTLPAYQAYGMLPFRPNPKQTLKSYYEVPLDILEDTDALAGWAQQAIGQALAGKDCMARPAEPGGR